MRKIARLSLAMIGVLFWGTVLRYCFREDACADASGSWDWRSRSCVAPWCTEEGGRWIEGPNYCIPRECVELGLDWDPKSKQCADAGSD
jgi:hypothetical protein